MTLIILAEDGGMAENVVCAMKLEAVVGPDTYFGGSPSLFRYGASPQRTIKNSTACDLRHLLFSSHWQSVDFPQKGSLCALWPSLLLFKMILLQLQNSHTAAN
jgi:hypothetical protein